MGKFVLTEHLPSSVSQYLLPSAGDKSVTGAVASPSSSSNSSTTSSSQQHRRSLSEPPKLLTGFDDQQERVGTVGGGSGDGDGGSGNASESNGSSATASDEELSSVCPEENVEVIHGINIGGGSEGEGGRLSPSFAPSSSTPSTTAYTISLSTGNSRQQQKNGVSGVGFGLFSHSIPRNCRTSRFRSDLPSDVNSEQQDHHNNMSLHLDRYGFITNLDSKGHVLETHGNDSVHNPTISETKRTERREKKWNGMLQGLEGRKNPVGGNRTNNKVSQPNRLKPKPMKETTTTPSSGGLSTSSPQKRKPPPATDSTIFRSNMAISRTKNQKLMIRRLRKGIPDSMRGRVWSVLGGGIRVPGLYQDIVQHTSDAMLDNFKHIQSNENADQKDNCVDDYDFHVAKHGTDGSPRPNTSSTVTTESSSHDEPTSSASTPQSQTKSKGNKSGSSSNTTSEIENTEFVRTQQFRSIQDTIERDIHRTFPRHNLFYEEERYTQDGGDNADMDSGDVASSSSPTAEQNASSNNNNNKTSTVMLASPTEAQTLISSTFCDPDMAALILNLERDIRMATMGETSEPVQPSDGASYTTTPGGQAALRRVLRAYSYYDQEVGYCQGMNFIAGMFLTVMSEEEAFWLLVAVMHNEPCRMRGMFGEGMRETHKVLYVGEKLMHHYLPRLARHFDKEHIHVTMFATQWLLTLYTSSFKFDLVFRVWDAFLGEGWKIIYRVMLALLQKYQNQLIKMSFEEILTFFRDLPEQVEGEQMMEMALKIPLRKKVISKYEKEWKQQQEQQR